MKHIVQPDNSELCGQACIAMAAGVSLKRAIKVIGHERGTHTKDVVAALRELGVQCDNRLLRMSHRRPNLPPRCIIHISRKPIPGERRGKFHWMLNWDGKIYDPGNRWPEGYENWRITSYLEIA